MGLTGSFSTNMQVNGEGNEMSYKVHRLDLNMETDREKLEDFLNLLKGEIVSIVPNVKPTFQFMGATAKVDFVYIIEKLP